MGKLEELLLELAVIEDKLFTLRLLASLCEKSKTLNAFVEENLVVMEELDSFCEARAWRHVRRRW